MKSKFCTLILGALISLAIAEDEFPDTPVAFPTALTVQVIDENGNNIGPCELHFEFRNSNHPKSFRGPVWSDVRNTDETGKLKVIEDTIGSINVTSSKDGYYRSMKKYTWNMRENWKQIQAEQRLIPWNPTITLTMKKIGDVVPMKVTPSFSIKLPGIGEEYVMDLLEADWLPPHGKGKVEDCFVSVIGNQKSSKLLIRFPNPNDGMIRVEPSEHLESRLRFPREAPVNGYLPSVEITTVYDAYMRQPSFEEAMASGYLFRIRTPQDGQESDEGPLYGKIVRFSSFSGIREWGGVPGARISSIHLYINPEPGDRRIEADMTQNLKPGQNPPLPLFP